MYVYGIMDAYVDIMVQLSAFFFFEQGTTISYNMKIDCYLIPLDLVMTKRYKLLSFVFMPQETS